MYYSIETSSRELVDQSYVQICYITLFGNGLTAIDVPPPMKVFRASFDELAVQCY